MKSAPRSLADTLCSIVTKLGLGRSAALMTFGLHLLAAPAASALTFAEWQASTPGAGTTHDANWDGDLANDLQEYALY